MQYTLELEGFEGNQPVVETGGLFRGPRLLQGGEPAPKGLKRGDYLLQRDDGREVVAHITPSMVGDPVPNLVVDGQRVQVARPFTVYEWIWMGMAVLLVFGGGALGALVGLLALTINTQIMRSGQGVLVRYGLTALISLLAAGIFLAVAVAVRGSFDTAF